jgi:predicted phosphodiesterase
MKIKLYSDLHTEFWPNHYFPEFLAEPTDVLILAGDIAVGKKNTEAFLKKVSFYHKHVIYIPGNHEYYGHDIHCLADLDTPMNTHYLNPGCIKIKDTTFIAATLWTNFNNNKTSEKVAGSYIADFKRIKGFTTLNAIELFNNHYDYILKCLRDIPGKKVVITHFLPSRQAIHKRWLSKDFPTKNLNDYFANQLDNLILTYQPLYWLFGHTHDSISTKLGDTTLLSNPYGYHNYEVNKEFQKDLILELA